MGLQEACTSSGSAAPQFPGDHGSESNPTFGDIYVGLNDKSSCYYLPTSPLCQPSPPQDNLQTLCNVSIWRGLTYKSTIQSLCQVACPSQLYQATGLRRSDEGVSSSTCTASSIPPSNTHNILNSINCLNSAFQLNYQIHYRSFATWIVPVLLMQMLLVSKGK